MNKEIKDLDQNLKQVKQNIADYIEENSNMEKKADRTALISITNALNSLTEKVKDLVWKEN